MDPRGLLDGALYAAQSPLALGAALAACLASMPASRRGAIAAAAALALASMLALLLPDTLPATPMNAAALVALGGFVAANQCLPRAWAALALVPGGAAAGLAAGIPTATPAETAGSVALLFALAATFLLLRTAVRLPARWRQGAAIGRRMAGAWIAAIGILLLALWMRGVA